MKRSWTALAAALCVVGVVASCNDYNNSVQYNTGATITNISPSGLPAGTPPGVTLANCPNTPSGQTNPCFTLFVLGSSTNEHGSRMERAETAGLHNDERKKWLHDVPGCDRRERGGAVQPHCKSRDGVRERVHTTVRHRE